MRKTITLSLSPRQAALEELYRPLFAAELGIAVRDVVHIRLVRRSIDARSRQVRVNLQAEVIWGEADELVQQALAAEAPNFAFDNVERRPEVIVIGAGPAGLFAALRLVELGFRPIVFERGKDVRARRVDIAAINRAHVVNADSNYSFGEGGAGTYSDGKLYTRSKKRGDVQRILSLLRYHGASDDILVDAHPHIGTNRLPRIIAAIRATLLEVGAVIQFNSRVVDFLLRDNRLEGVVLADGSQHRAAAVILATGHSARDIFELLERRQIRIEAKPFAMGLRVEHPQELIDSIQYHCTRRDDYLPAAAYSLVHQVQGRGVYSFCMCPGGFIVPAATAPGEVVVNGMSPSSRNSRYANSGMVVEIRLEDLPASPGPAVLAGLRYQQQLEQLAWQHGGGTQAAPAQRLTDFVNGRASSSLPSSSYQPGMTASAMHEWLPSHLGPRLRGGFKAFGDKMRGFLTDQAVVLGVESRTSSPVKIPREPDTCQHPQIRGLFPCGEGGGYAGGIVSSAMDGERCAEAVAQLVQAGLL